uniref:Integrase catalytic domain-containing protein n=1 Tax=Salarias fasciatus TaxID=181472 RepID=A0A672F450_SALFA
MFIDVEKKVRTCERCVRRKARAEKTAPLVNIHTSRPLELICIDYLSLEPDGRGTKNILVITDHFTKYAIAVPTADQKAKTVAKTLWNSFFVHYGMPERIHSDQGRDFESALIKELCQLLGIKKTRTTPYHPRGNPVERFNRTLLEMLGTLQEEDKVKWRDFVQPLVHSYNCTKNDTTGFSPYQLMFGRQPNLPIDVAFGLSPEGQKKVTHTDYVKKLRENLQESYKLAIEHSEKTAQCNKQRYDFKVRESILEIGDHVLIKNVAMQGKHKIADRWSSTVYKVVKHIDDSPVYVVAPLTSDGPERILHRDLLLPCGFLAPSIQEEVDQVKEKKGRAQTPHEQEASQESCEPEQQFQSEEMRHYYPQAAQEPITFPTVTIIHETPHIQVAPTMEDDDEMNTEGSNLNPEADEFQPMRNLEEDNIEKNENLPAENDPGIGDESVQSESEREITNGENGQNMEENDDEVIMEEGCEIDGQDEDDSKVDDKPIRKETECPELRRSTRQRTEPDRLTYNSLG